MIDRVAREKAIQLLVKIFTEGITNYCLEDNWPDGSPDYSLKAISEQLWFYYDESPEKILVRNVFGPDIIALIERCIAFLTSDLEYEWPKYSFETENRALIERILGLGKRRAAAQWAHFKSAGDIDAWPFLRIEDYRRTLNQIEEDKRRRTRRKRVSPYIVTKKVAGNDDDGDR